MKDGAMSAMLILIFFSSLAPLARAFLRPECGTIYQCIAPEMCVDQTKLILDGHGVKEVLDKTELIDNCPALIKFHEYRINWMRVSIESFDDKISSIMFYQINDVTKDEKSKFSCKLEGGKIEGKYQDSLKSLKESSTTLLKCVFDVKLPMKKQKVINFEYDDLFKFEVIREGTPPTTEGTVATNIVLTNKVRCDPARIDFHYSSERSQVYEKIDVEPGKYECKNSVLFRLQYREKGSPAHKTVGKLECDKQKFKIDGTEVVTAKIDIRCAADAHFFCKYDVKGVDNEKKPDFNEPNEIVPKAGSLKCPHDKPHLIVNTKLILNAKMECYNYGNSKFWTVVDSSDAMKSIPLTKDGPEVYCTNEVECYKMYRIPESAVPTGRLGIDRFPECLKTGVLKFNNKDVTDKTCDRTTGDFKFKTGGDWIIVDKETIFDCMYPKNTTEKDIKDEKNLGAIKKSAFITAGSSLGMILLVLLGMFALVRWRLQQNQKKLAKMDNAVFMTYCMSADEKKEYLHKNNLPSEKSFDNVVLEPNWNKMIMSSLYKSVAFMTADGKECAENDAKFNVYANGDEDPSAELEGVKMKKVLHSRNTEIYANFSLPKSSIYKANLAAIKKNKDDEKEKRKKEEEAEENGKKQKQE